MSISIMPDYTNSILVDREEYRTLLLNRSQLQMLKNLLNDSNETPNIDTYKWIIEMDERILEKEVDDAEQIQ